MWRHSERELLLHGEASHEWNHAGERERLVVVPRAAQVRVTPSIISPHIKSLPFEERNRSRSVVGADHIRSDRDASLARAAHRFFRCRSYRPFGRRGVPALNGSVVEAPGFFTENYCGRRAFSSWRCLMSIAPVLWLLITAGGAALLGIVLLIGLVTTRRRRENPVAQRLTNAATREMYPTEDELRPDRMVPGTPSTSDAPNITITEARQGVRGHKVSTVLGLSLALAALAAFILYGWLWIYPTSFGRHTAPKQTVQGMR